MKVGLYGGTFDPIHNAHIMCARFGMEMFALDELLFVPAFKQPNKDGSHADAEDRAEMVARAIVGEPRFGLSRIELDREGPSYTADTIDLMEKERPGDTFCFIMGLDAFKDTASWRRAEYLLHKIDFIVFYRPGDSPNEVVGHLNRQLPGRFTVIPAKDGNDLVYRGSAKRVYLRSPFMEPISSTTVRRMVRTEQPYTHLVPGPVASYIKEKGLYTNG